MGLTTDALEQQEALHRTHCRMMTTARQHAERRKDSKRGATPEMRREAEANYRAEIHRLDTEHRVWLDEHTV
jgi:hypothetical protein